MLLTVNQGYTLLGLLTLDPGSWADWFSGTMSAAAVITALGGYWWSERQRRRDNEKRVQASGKQIGIKIFKLMNNMNDIHRHISADRSHLKIGGVDNEELWRYIQPIVGMSDDPSLHLDAHETELLIDYKKTKFLMDLMLATTRYTSIVSSMKEYHVKYDALHDLMPTAYANEGDVFSHELDEKEYWTIKPYSAALDTLIRSIRDMAVENQVDCRRLASEYAPLMKSIFKTDKWLTLAEPGARQDEQP